MSGCQTSASSCARFCRALWSGGPYKVPGAGAAMAQQDLYRRRTSGATVLCWMDIIFFGGFLSFLWPKVVWICLNVVRSSSRLCRYFFAEQFAEVMILGLKGEHLWFVQKQVYPCIPNKINGLRSQNFNIFFLLNFWRDTIGRKLPYLTGQTMGFMQIFPNNTNPLIPLKPIPRSMCWLICVYIYVYIYLYLYIFLHANLYAYLDLHLYI